MAKMVHASHSAARFLHRRYGGAIADPTALPRMPNFSDDFLVYDHTTGKTPVLVPVARAINSCVKIA